MLKNLIPAPPVVKMAFALGEDIVTAEQGFHFQVYTDFGETFTGCPEPYSDEGILILDCVGGSPTPIIDVRRITAITVLEV